MDKEAYIKHRESMGFRVEPVPHQVWLSPCAELLLWDESGLREKQRMRIDCDNFYEHEPIIVGTAEEVMNRLGFEFLTEL